MARRTSPLASGSVLPSSRVMSARDLIELLVEDVGGFVQDVAARRRRSWPTSPGSAAAAAAAAASTSAAVPLTKMPTTSSVLAGLRFSKVLAPFTHSPLM